MSYLLPAIAGLNSGYQVFAQRVIGKERQDGGDSVSRMKMNAIGTLALRTSWKAIRIAQGGAPISTIASLAAWAIPLSSWAVHYLAREDVREEKLRVYAAIQPEDAEKLWLDRKVAAPAARALLQVGDFFRSIPGAVHIAGKVHNHFDKLCILLSVAQGIYAITVGQYIFAGAMVGSCVLGLISENYFSPQYQGIVHEVFFISTSTTSVVLGSLLQRIWSCFLLFGECKRAYDYLAKVRLPLAQTASIYDLTRKLRIPDHDPAPRILFGNYIEIPEGYGDIMDQLGEHTAVRALAFYRSIEHANIGPFTDVAKELAKFLKEDNFDFYPFLRSLSLEGQGDPLGWRERDVRIHRPHTNEEVAPKNVVPLTEENVEQFKKAVQEYDFSCVDLEDLFTRFSNNEAAKGNPDMFARELATLKLLRALVENNQNSLQELAEKELSAALDKISELRRQANEDSIQMGFVNTADQLLEKAGALSPIGQLVATETALSWVQNLEEKSLDDWLPLNVTAKLEEIKAMTSWQGRNLLEQTYRAVLNDSLRRGIENLLAHSLRINTPKESLQRILAFLIHKVNEKGAETTGQLLVDWGLYGHACNVRKNRLIYRLYSQLVRGDQSSDTDLRLKILTELENMRGDLREVTTYTLNRFGESPVEKIFGGVGAACSTLFNGEFGADDLHNAAAANDLAPDFEGRRVVQEADKCDQFQRPQLAAMQAAWRVLGASIRACLSPMEKGISSLTKKASPGTIQKLLHTLQIYSRPDKLFSFAPALFWGQYSVQKVANAFKHMLFYERVITEEEIRTFIHSWWKENAGSDAETMKVGDLKERANEGGALSPLNAFFKTEDREYHQRTIRALTGDDSEEEFLNTPVRDVLDYWVSALNASDTRLSEIDSCILFVLSALGVLEIRPTQDAEEPVAPAA